MHILVSNDDGYQASGIQHLARALAQIADISVVAPDRDRSGASNSLNLRRPLYIARHDNGFISVEAGTPTDCVHLAINGLLEQEPDMVVSGINNGSNMGDDVIYSGTVAAAMEGRFLGLPAIAISMVTQDAAHYATAARAAQILLQRNPLPADTILNVNVPDVTWEELAGFQATRLGNRHKSEPVVKAYDPRGRAIYWIGPAGAEQDAGEGTDFFAVRNNYVSVTPLTVDLTRYRAMNSVQEWLHQL
jgi:5'-nucleotidase